MLDFLAELRRGRRRRRERDIVNDDTLLAAWGSHLMKELRIVEVRFELRFTKRVERVEHTCATFSFMPLLIVTFQAAHLVFDPAMSGTSDVLNHVPRSSQPDGSIEIYKSLAYRFADAGASGGRPSNAAIERAVIASLAIEGNAQSGLPQGSLWEKLCRKKVGLSVRVNEQ